MASEETGTPQAAQSGGVSRAKLLQHAPHTGSRRPEPRRAAHSGQTAGKRRSSAAVASARMRASRSAASGAHGVPAAATLAALPPAGDAGATRRARVRPLEGMAEAEGTAVLVAGGRGFATPLEDRAEIRMDEGRLGRPNFHLLELI